MKQIVHLTLLLILLGGLAAGPVWSEEKKAAPAQQAERDSQGPSSSMGEMKDPSPQNGMKGKQGNMMGEPMMSMMANSNDIMGKMLDTMKEMAQVLKSQIKDPQVQAKADQMMAHIQEMKDQHKVMMGMMDMMIMSEHGAGPPMK